jgi:hypothetical protein
MCIPTRLASSAGTPIGSPAEEATAGRALRSPPAPLPPRVKLEPFRPGIPLTGLDPLGKVVPGGG